MAVVDGNILIRDKGMYKEVKINKAKKILKEESLYTMSMHTGHNQEYYTELLKIEEKGQSNKSFNLKFESPTGRKYELVCDPETEFYTLSRGYVNVKDITKADVFFDIEGRYCKILKKEYNTNTNLTFWDLNVKYNKNYYFNGILLR
jgi:hypothetical protein